MNNDIFRELHLTPDLILQTLANTLHTGKWPEHFTHHSNVPPQ